MRRRCIERFARELTEFRLVVSPSYTSSRFSLISRRPQVADAPTVQSASPICKGCNMARYMIRELGTLGGVSSQPFVTESRRYRPNSPSTILETHRMSLKALFIVFAAIGTTFSAVALADDFPTMENSGLAALS